MEEFKEFLKRPEVIILGGNDNSPRQDYLYTLGQNFKYIPSYEECDTLCRKEGNAWVIFNKTTGSRLIWSFNDTKCEPSHPISVDIKVTNKCNFGCPYCYQNSTPEGKESATSDWEIAEYLRNIRIFEVSIGGGEPTLWDGLNMLIEDLYNSDIVPNFTTRNYEWLKSNPSTISRVGQIGVSVSTIEDVMLVNSIVTMHCIDKKKIVPQITLGVIKEEDFAKLYKFIKDLDYKISLVGFKTTGRGEKYSIIEYKDWITRYLSGYTYIDSVIASTVNLEGLPYWSYSVKEGQYSCYIDFVEGKVATSSFSNDKVDLPEAKDFSKTFKTLNKTI
jgi:MoaA/NifB/PqqE/SkfB family radical SAM enzyme